MFRPDTDMERPMVCFASHGLGKSVSRQISAGKENDAISLRRDQCAVSAGSGGSNRPAGIDDGIRPGSGPGGRRHRRGVGFPFS